MDDKLASRIHSCRKVSRNRRGDKCDFIAPDSLLQFKKMLSLSHSGEVLERLMLADEFGVKLEVVEGAYTWEFSPSPFHQGVVREIDRSIRPTPGNIQGSECYVLHDAYVRFPDGSLKRPDLMIFAKKPELTWDALNVIPEAVVEVLSPGGDRKDLEVGPKFYLSQGIRDVIVVHPEDGWADHFTADNRVRYSTPKTISLACGCDLTV